MAALSTRIDQPDLVLRAAAQVGCFLTCANHSMAEPGNIRVRRGASSRVRNWVKRRSRLRLQKWTPRRYLNAVGISAHRSKVISPLVLSLRMNLCDLRA